MMEQDFNSWDDSYRKQDKTLSTNGNANCKLHLVTTYRIFPLYIFWIRFHYIVST